MTSYNDVIKAGKGRLSPTSNNREFSCIKPNKKKYHILIMIYINTNYTLSIIPINLLVKTEPIVH